MTDHERIAKVLNRFMNCFDLKDWQSMRGLLEPTIGVDYADLRGGSPTNVASDEYVGSRCEALAELATHHVLANMDIDVLDGSATVSASCLIFRSDGTRHFNSHAFYTFVLNPTDDSWKISAIAQRILWNEGDPGIHKGARSRPA